MDPTERLSALDNFPFEDEQPEAEGPALAIYYDSFVDYNYEERSAFSSRWTEETFVIQKVEDMLAQGERHINMLYTYRSCSKTLPQVKTADQENKSDIYNGTFEVLEPEIKKLKDFMYFQRNCVKFFADTVKRLVGKKDGGFSEILAMYLVRLLDLLALLDALKNMKACLNNDFSFFKRAVGFLRKNMSGADDQTQENHTLYLFLAHQNSITTHLKDEMRDLEGSEEVLAQFANTCAAYVEAERFVLPSEKHCLLRAMPYLLFLMDGEDQRHNVFKSKFVNIPQLARIFKKYPVVPVYGDMQISLEALIRRSPHFDEKVWGSGSDPRSAQEYEIVHHIDVLRERYNDYLVRFSLQLNEIRCLKREKPKDRLPLPVGKQATNLVLEGMLLLSDMTGRILQQSAWKYSTPNYEPSIETEVDYERVVRYNYRPEERLALIETIAMTKGLASVLLKNDVLLSTLIRYSIHDELQDFIQQGVREIIRTVSKKTIKKTTTRNDLLQIRQLAADWLNGTEPVDPALYGKKATKDTSSLSYPSRQVGPSVTQLDLLRNILYGLLHKKKEFSAPHMKLLDDFYQKSFFYPYLLNMQGTIVHCTDVGDLWYREFYLELSKRLQFPIEMSLPWILADSLLEAKEGGMGQDLIEYVLFPFEVYNDAANRALNGLHQRFLYDEIEAEVNLCFDQLIYKLAEQIFSWFKASACSVLLDKSFKLQLETLYERAKDRFYVPKSRFDVLFNQRHFVLLGRSVDLNAMITQRMNTYLRQNIDYAICRFESADLSNIVELDVQLQTLRLVHRMMSQYLDVDPWDSILAEINESTSLASFHGRMLLHIIFELVYDFAPNFNYNSVSRRFIRTPDPFTEETPREPPPKSNPLFLWGNKHLNAIYIASLEVYKTFFGHNHIQSLLRVLGRASLPMVVGECLRNMDLKVQNVLSPYVAELMGGMPASSKLPMHEYGVEGCFGMFQMKLREIIQYPDLKPEALQHFRELGNSVLLFLLIDTEMHQIELSTTVEAAPFLGIRPEQYTSKSERDPSGSSPVYAIIHGLCKHLSQNPAEAKASSMLQDLIMNAWRADKFYRQPSSHISLFKAVLQQVQGMLDPVRDDWSGKNNPPENGVLEVDGPHEFYRLWSALEFVCCMPAKDQYQYLELFGDGLFWGGCTIIHLLGQKRRFDTFNFTYHTLNIEEAAAQPCRVAEMLRFFRNVHVIRDLNVGIFNTLSAYYPVEDGFLSRGIEVKPPDTLQLKQYISLQPAEAAASSADMPMQGGMGSFAATGMGGMHTPTPTAGMGMSGFSSGFAAFGGNPPPPPPGGGSGMSGMSGMGGMGMGGMGMGGMSMSGLGMGGMPPPPPPTDEEEFFEESDNIYS